MKRAFSFFLDAFLPLSSESVIARALSEKELAKLVTPALHTREPWVYCLFRYSDPKVRALMRAIKYRGEKVPLPVLGKIAGDEIMSILEDKVLFEGWKNILLVPIPSAPRRLKKRGYNQADRIARGALPYLESMLSYAPDILARRDRQSQVDVAKEERRRNIEGAFFVPDNHIIYDKIHGSSIILIDDIAESGATLSDARRALIEAGATDVIAVAIAH